MLKNHKIKTIVTLFILQILPLTLSFGLLYLPYKDAKYEFLPYLVLSLLLTSLLSLFFANLTTLRQPYINRNLTPQISFFSFLLLTVFQFIDNNGFQLGYFVTSCIGFLFILIRKRFKDNQNLFTVFLGIAIWIPVEFGFIDGLIGDLNDFAPFFFIFFALNLVFYLLFELGQKQCMNPVFRVRRTDLKWLNYASILLLITLIPFGLFTEFLKLRTEINYPLLPLYILGLFFVNGLPEEVLFRGIFQKSCESFLRSPISALILTSVFFGFCHLNNFPTGDWRWVVSATWAGIIYGWIFLKTEGLTAPSILHAGTNGITLLLFEFQA